MPEQPKPEYKDWIDRTKVLLKVVVMDGDKILALKRSPDSFSRPNCWDLCGGALDMNDIDKAKAKSGKGDENDILVVAAEREILEETRLSVGSLKTVHAASGFNDKKEMFILAIGYLGFTEDTDVQLSDEHSEYRWVSKEEFKELVIGDDGGLLHSIINAL